ncbi:MAG: N-acyl homoserine lactonase family protein [Pseudomonadota bacterium]|jgi:Zn-dependent hydrolases, including glyoxylases|nr:MAG: MBL fold hydrolase [Pseudomonadota bacterium]
MEAVYELFAIRYGHLERTAAHNFIGGDPHDGPMPLDYYVWVIRGADRTFVLDTGFDAATGTRRGRTLVRPIADGLAIAGVDPASVRDVIVSHMHYDHAGNLDLFPRARFHVQADEMAFCTGPAMCHAVMRAPFEAADVQTMVGKLFEGRVVFHDGVSELAPGITLHKVGGHTRGLQVVRVHTRRGWVVLASDAAHFYANWQQRRPFPIVDSVSQYLAAFDTIERLASSPAHVIPGHDPLVLAHYPAARDGVSDVVRLDLDPIG